MAGIRLFAQEKTEARSRSVLICIKFESERGRQFQRKTKADCEFTKLFLVDEQSDPGLAGACNG